VVVDGGVIVFGFLTISTNIRSTTFASMCDVFVCVLTICEAVETVIVVLLYCD